MTQRPVCAYAIRQRDPVWCSRTSIVTTWKEGLRLITGDDRFPRRSVASLVWLVWLLVWAMRLLHSLHLCAHRTRFTYVHSGQMRLGKCTPQIVPMSRRIGLFARCPSSRVTFKC